MAPDDLSSSERTRLELERLRSEIALNNAQVKKLSRRGIGRLLVIFLGVVASVWTFAATFTGFLADLSEISKKELPKAREQLDSLRVRNVGLEDSVSQLRREKERADSLQVALHAALASLFALKAPRTLDAADSVYQGKQPWRSSLLLIEINYWAGPLVVALMDEKTVSGEPLVVGFRFCEVSTLERTVYGSWSTNAQGIGIVENVNGILLGYHSRIYIDLTTPLPEGGFSARWESHLGKGAGIAYKVGKLSAK